MPATYLVDTLIQKHEIPKNFQNSFRAHSLKLHGRGALPISFSCNQCQLKEVKL
jgi:hypothetical protein